MLIHNFRSRPEILTHSLQVIAHNPSRFEKNLQATRDSGNEVLLVYEENASSEAETVVEILQKLYQAGKFSNWRDVAILLRSVKSYSAPYIEALVKAGIPFQVIGDASLFLKDEIAQVYELFSFLSTAKAWGDRFLRDPLVGLSDNTCEILKTYKDSLCDLNTKDELHEIGITDKDDLQKILELIQLKKRVQMQQHSSILEVFYSLLSITGCFQRFERNDQIEALSNLGILSQIIANWDEYSPTNNFYAFQDYLKLVKEEASILTFHKIWMRFR
jgi:DNA helicase-2/ATP-dependent DNA helicase PcrA